MSVELDPPELGFRRPFTHEVTQVLKLTNTNSDPVAFKVKTTAPKQYCVRPNSGSIEPGKSVEVQVLLQAMKEDPPLDTRCRDKFLVQSVAILVGQVSGDENVWTNLDQVAKDSVKEKKIRVNFLPARDSTVATNGTSRETPPGYAPPTPQSTTTSPTDTVAPQTTRNFLTPSKDVTGSAPPYAAVSSAIARGTSESNHSTNSATSSVPITERVAEIYNSATQSVSNAASATGATLQQQLDSAKETIISLKEQIQSQNLRQRQNASGSDSKDRSAQSGSSSLLASSPTTGVALQQHTSDGVPVQMVAALCMLSFLIAYFFF